MSNAVNGVIENINFRPINADGSPNQWQKTHRTDITIGGVRYGGPDCKPSPRGELELRVQNGKDWVTLLAGDQVQFFTKTRESGGKTYYNVEGKIMLVAKGNGVSQPQPSAPAPTRQAAPQAGAAASAPGQPSALDLRIEDGQVFNNVMSYLVATQQEFTPNNIKSAAVLVRKCLLAFRAAGCGREVGNAVPQAQAAPAAAPAAAQPAQATPPPAAVTAQPQQAAKPEFDEDDIPF